MRSFLSSSLSSNDNISSMSISTPLLMAVSFLGSSPLLAFLAFLATGFVLPFLALALPVVGVFLLFFALGVEFSGLSSVFDGSEGRAGASARNIVIRDAPHHPRSSEPSPRRHLITRRLSVFDKPALGGATEEVNPFVNKTARPSFYEKCKLVFMAPVAVVRLSAGLGTVLVLAVACKMLTLGLSKQDLKERPLSGFRRRLLEAATRACGRALLFCLGFHWIVRRGRRASRDEAPIVVANHTCMIDPFLMGALYVPSPVGAVEHLSAPVLGWVFAALQLITVDRTDPNSRHAVKDTIQRRAVDPRWPQQTLIFPEATCTNGTALITFRGGPFAPGVPVQPVCVRFPHKHFDPCWVPDGPKMSMILYRLMCQFHNYLEVDFLPPHVPSAAEKADAILYGNHVRARMARVMDVPCTSHGYEDVRLQAAARKLHLPASAGVVGMQGVKETFERDVRQDTVAKHLAAFAAMDPTKTGRVDCAQFAKGFGVAVTENLERLFALLDNDGSGYLDFREYLLGLALLNETEDRTGMLKLVFKVFDKSGGGRMSVGELTSFLHRCGYGEVDAVGALREATGDAGATSVSYDEFARLNKSHPEYMNFFSDKMKSLGD